MAAEEKNDTIAAADKNVAEENISGTPSADPAGKASDVNKASRGKNGSPTAQAKGKAGEKKSGAGATGKKNPGAPMKNAGQNGRDRKDILREQKAQINADLKKLSRKIMLGGSVVTILAVIGLMLMTSRSGGMVGAFGSALLLVAVAGFGGLGVIVFRMYSSGRQAAIRRAQRRQSEMARQDLHQFTSKLSVETREKLMQVDSRRKATAEEPAEAMYLKLNDDELSNALQFLCMTSREGELALNFAAGDVPGQLFLKGGTMVYAQFGKYEGLEAMARMLKKGAADASFFEGRPEPKRNIDMSISGILLNASVMGDEME